LDLLDTINGTDIGKDNTLIFTDFIDRYNKTNKRVFVNKRYIIQIYDDLYDDSPEKISFNNQT
jgi:hypothetical protein